ncbi:MAG: hypothetical protein DMG30_28810 [Acidobacteria bacterium]|nr:MAG: hypothetical protein DMG30_28810 [Acidobacteriota bacterium]
MDDVVQGDPMCATLRIACNLLAENYQAWQATASSAPDGTRGENVIGQILYVQVRAIRRPHDP